jgi:protocatechuate 3,4-dioxygenase beta subunit
MRIILVFVLILFTELFAHSHTKPLDPIIAQCKVSIPTINNLPKPISFASTNNLVHKTGSFETAKGETIIIAGRLIDKNCIPISNGVVKIWQADSKGLMSYRNSADQSQAAGDPNFSGTGTATTDNLGRFIIYTVYPGLQSKLQDARFINLMAQYDKQTIITKGYMDPQAATMDPEFLNLKSRNKTFMIFSSSINNNTRIFNIDLVMNYAQRNKTY